MSLLVHLYSVLSLFFYYYYYFKLSKRLHTVGCCLPFKQPPPLAHPIFYLYKNHIFFATCRNSLFNKRKKIIDVSGFGKIHKLNYSWCYLMLLVKRNPSSTITDHSLFYFTPGLTNSCLSSASGPAPIPNPEYRSKNKPHPE